MNPPPARFVRWAIATLRLRSKRGDYPPDGWLEWLEAMDKALKAGEAAQIEVLGATDITRFIEKEF